MRDEEGRGLAIREYNPDTDRDGTEAVDQECDIIPTGRMSLHADLLGDSVTCICISPHYLMQVHTYVCSNLWSNPPIYVRVNARLRDLLRMLSQVAANLFDPDLHEQVAETSDPGRRIVGLIRETVKSVASGKSRPGPLAHPPARAALGCWCTRLRHSRLLRVAASTVPKYS
jgi:Tfp pilus assembly protein PilN